jgi:anti-sigma factor RsiW
MADLSDDEKADLTAYLDGELDEETSQAFEARLSRDPKLRAEADSLKRTWEMLDYLPRPEPPNNFTQRTLERLAIRNTSKAVAVPKRRWAWLAPAGWAAAMVAAMVGGLLAAQQLWPVPAVVDQKPPVVEQKPPQPERDEFDAQLARNLGAVENYRLYSNVDDLKFARQLGGVLGDEEEGS